MNWRNIKNFLILLFLIINIYLIFSIKGFDFKKEEKTYLNPTVLSDTVDIVKNNYGFKLNPYDVPQSIDNLSIIDVKNIIYTDSFKSSPYDFKTEGASFEAVIETKVYSYNESNAKTQFLNILTNIGIDKDSYILDIRKSDHGIICTAKERFGSYSIFNGKITGEFSPSEIILSGSWYITDPENTKEKNVPSKMADIAGVIIDLASQLAASDGQQRSIDNINYGYYVSYYDINSVSKSSSAIPCYSLKLDDGSKYYYDALNGKLLSKEE